MFCIAPHHHQWTESQHRPHCSVPFLRALAHSPWPRLHSRPLILALRLFGLPQFHYAPGGGAAPVPCMYLRLTCPRDPLGRFPLCLIIQIASARPELGPLLRGLHRGEGHAGKSSWAGIPSHACLPSRGRGGGARPGLKDPEDFQTGPEGVPGIQAMAPRVWPLGMRNDGRTGKRTRSTSQTPPPSDVPPFSPPHPCQSPASTLLPTFYLFGPAPRGRASPRLLNHRCAQTSWARMA